MLVKVLLKCVIYFSISPGCLGLLMVRKWMLVSDDVLWSCVIAFKCETDYVTHRKWGEGCCVWHWFAQESPPLQESKGQKQLDWREDTGRWSVAPLCSPISCIGSVQVRMRANASWWKKRHNSTTDNSLAVRKFMEVCTAYTKTGSQSQHVSNYTWGKRSQKAHEYCESTHNLQTTFQYFAESFQWMLVLLRCFWNVSFISLFRQYAFPYGNFLSTCVWCTHLLKS